MVALVCLGTFPYVAWAQCVGGSLQGGGIVLFKTTGDAALDATINGEANTLASVFGVAPTLFTMDDQQSANAFANCSAGQVLIGLRLLREQLWRMEYGPLAVAGIMAHEFTHIYQCNHSVGLNTTKKELQADYMAGWYLKREKVVYGLDVSGFARSVWSMGDYNFRDPAHHGTPDQRVAAMTAGFNDSAATVSTAYANSVRYLNGGTPEPCCGPPTPQPEPEPKTCKRTVPCGHPMPCRHRVTVEIDRIVCQHPVPCRHPVMTPYGVLPAHNADPMHLYDPVMGTIPAHPEGDARHESDVIEVPCDD
jgi:hypothetical protein